MKIKVGVLYGGKTTEHEVSIITALQAMKHLNKDKYDVVPIYLTKENEFYTGEALKDFDVYKDFNLLKRYCTNVICYGKNNLLILEKKNSIFKKVVNEIDIVLLTVHGYNMEDGNIQGLLEVYNVAYTGSDIYGCTLGQDKVFQKQVLSSSNLPVTDYVWFYDNEYFDDPNTIIKKVSKLKFPVIVKPARQGSSIGISVAKDEKSLDEMIKDAIKYDDKILVEKVVDNMVELNCSVLGNNNYMEASEIERVMKNDEILSFNDKYIGRGKKGAKTIGSKTNNTSRVIPADIKDELKNKIQDTSKQAFKALGASGVVRIDYLYDSKKDKYYINELNTIPGSLSFYLWNYNKKSYEKLLDEIINIAIKRYKTKMKKTTTFESNILSGYNGSKGFKGKLK